MPGSGGKLTSPRQAVVSGNPDTFTVVKTKSDATWEYSFYTANLPFDAGSYTLYAVSSPVAIKPVRRFDNLRQRQHHPQKTLHLCGDLPKSGRTGKGIRGHRICRGGSAGSPDLGHRK